MYYGGDGSGEKPDYPCWVVQDVPGRSEIKIHVANRAKQLRGCIAPGLGLGCVEYEWAVIQSAAAFQQLMEATAGQTTLQLAVSDPPGDRG